ncbi:MAG: response regulator [Alphaproteobacteria bacterium]|nr:response regulator [Alphaproteobacteria bacterium]
MAKILVIDDDSAIRSLLGLMLERAGHEVRLYANGRLALTSIDAGEAFDLVVTDILMPEMDGIEVIAALRSHGSAPLILAISGAGSPPSVDLLKAATNLGAQGALQKPFTDEVFLGLVEDLLRRHASARV